MTLSNAWKIFRYIISITIVLNHVKFCPPRKRDSLLQHQEVEREGKILLASSWLKPGILLNILEDNLPPPTKKYQDNDNAMPTLRKLIYIISSISYGKCIQIKK